ncbi:AbrB/MazE/SpoVT family DNA-binding domain-containing protein [Rhodospira trueperi]|uniref:Looped-hinge helix DNA binding domain-containing protein, AbrB family n=1 Tax=Rhodospira trueperi TaxID=69960 RepID=A0A1G6W8T8_9PROT|nr:AbrB/MazE/SpoVT family DNA-binding domain-containing protein [Rhodospira trueperi]SDD62272.1 looped-hinge helix DNA binding domain-containing protein, AbrB family [Rhodospira trueperi]
MELARLTASGRMTLPKAIRKAAGLRGGETLTFAVEGDRVIVRKATPDDETWREALSATLSEWTSPEDATRRGLEHGLQQGLQQGLKEGGQAVMLRLAWNLLDLGVLTDEQIARATELTLEEVRALRAAQ